MWVVLLANLQLTSAIASEPLGDPTVGGDAAPVVEEWVLAWSTVGFQPAQAESPALGPDWLAAGGEHAALWDPVERRVLVLSDASVVGTFALDRLDDLAVSDEGDVVLRVGRQVALVDLHGQTLGEITLSGLTPNSGHLAVEGEDLGVVDPFGNFHGVARLHGHALFAWNGPPLRPSPRPKPTPAEKQSALKVGVTQVGDWRIVERVVADHPLRVERTAEAGPTVIPLPLDDRAYAPSRDLAVDGEGRLLMVRPMADGLHVVRVSR